MRRSRDGANQGMARTAGCATARRPSPSTGSFEHHHRGGYVIGRAEGVVSARRCPPLIPPRFSRRAGAPTSKSQDKRVKEKEICVLIISGGGRPVSLPPRRAQTHTHQLPVHTHAPLFHHNHPSTMNFAVRMNRPAGLVAGARRATPARVAGRVASRRSMALAAKASVRTLPTSAPRLAPCFALLPRPKPAADPHSFCAPTRTPQDMSEQLEKSIKTAQETCEDGTQADCAVAWDEVRLCAYGRARACASE